MRLRLLFILCLMSMICQAQNVKTYELNKKKELTIGATCLILGVTDYVLSNKLKPLGEVDILKLDVNDLPSFDRSATRQFSASAKDKSDIFEYGVFFIPTTLLFSKKGRAEAKEIGTMYFEAFSLNVFSTQLVKYITRRNRPFMYNESIDINLKKTTNGRKSFYSGHVSHTPPLSIFTAKVFSDFYPGSKWKPVVWSSAFAIPVITGYYRYKSGQHFPSDITAGLVAGTLIGYFIPELHRLKKALPKDLNLDSTSDGLSITYSF